MKEERVVKQKSPIAQVWELGKSGHKQIIFSIILALICDDFGREAAESWKL